MILRQINEVTYKLDLPCHCCIAPSFHVSHMKSIIPGPLATDIPPVTPPPPVDIEGQPVYLVKVILSSQCRNGKLEYLIKWEGYDPEEYCWIPAQDILDPNLCRESSGCICSVTVYVVYLALSH